MRRWSRSLQPSLLILGALVANPWVTGSAAAQTLMPGSYGAGLDGVAQVFLGNAANNLVVGGWISTAGGVAVDGVAAWNGK